MKPKALLMLAALCAGLLLPSCTVVQRKPDGSVVGLTIGSDADAMVVDGPAPVVVAYSPVYNKKGVMTGTKAVYGPGDPNGPRVLFAGYGVNHSKGLAKVCNVVTTTALGIVAGSVQKEKDAAAAANEAKQIAANKAVKQQELANQAAKDGYTHAENMVGLEEAAGTATSVTP